MSIEGDLAKAGSKLLDGEDAYRLRKKSRTVKLSTRAAENSICVNRSGGEWG